MPAKTISSKTSTSKAINSIKRFAPFFLMIGFSALDEWMRGRARKEDFLADFPLFRFELHWNDGVFGGNGVENGPLFNQVFLSTISLLFITILILVGFIYRKDKIPFLKGGLFSLGFGLLLNVKDRLLFGRVTDWIILKKGILENYAFNGADLLIAAGLLGLIYLLIFKSERFWVEHEQRGKILIHKKFQFNFALRLCAMVFTIFLFSSLCTLLFFKAYLTSISQGSHVFNEWGMIYSVLWIMIVTIIGVIGFYYGIYYAHRLIQPILNFGDEVTAFLNKEKIKSNPQHKLFSKIKFEPLQSLILKMRELFSSRL